MDGFANRNRLYYHRMCSQYQGDVYDRLHNYFVGSNSLLGHVVVVSGDIRFEEILPQSADCPFRHPKKWGSQTIWLNQLHIFSRSFYKTNISFTQLDFVPQRVIRPKGWRNRLDSPLSPSIAVRRRKDCHRSRPVYCIMRSRLSQSALLAIEYHLYEIFLNCSLI